MSNVVMVRPKWEEVYQGAGFYDCNCEHTLTTFEALRFHWMSGHFDYVDDEKTNDKMRSEEGWRAFWRLEKRVEELERRLNMRGAKEE